MSTTRTQNTAITVTDLLRMQARSNGYGYICHEIRTPLAWVDAPGSGAQCPYMAVAALDRAIVAAANKLGWCLDQLFAYVDSRPARHAADAAIGNDIETAKSIMTRSMGLRPDAIV